MPTENRLALAQVRLNNARECLADAETTLSIGAYKNAANRSYYAIFHAIRAVLAIDAFDSRRHSGIIAEFRHKYIKPGVFPSEYSDIIGDAFKIRNNSDYDDFYIVPKEDVVRQVDNAKTFIAAVEGYIKTLKKD